ncbi:MAG: pyroglutamyl-peptidase I [Acholeplasmataceae bacterium]|jgi:pyroglutamyl-peptidase|nr:pyroglutamyl-peptidase I [Acholeplasmataceae bacterium]
MKTVILTGFTPFDGESINPSYEAIQMIESDDYELIKLRIPTTFEHSIEIIADSVKKHQPDLILMIGQAGGRQGISLERFAVNLDDSEIFDNAGIMKHESKIVSDGPIAYQTNLNLKSILKDLMQQGIPSKISNTAGTYVCNHIMYGIYHMIEKEKLHTKALFVHVPYAHEQVKNKPDTFSMSIEEIANAIHIIMDSILS